MCRHVSDRSVCVRRGQAGGGLPAHGHSEKWAIPGGFGVSVLDYKVTRLLGSIIKLKWTL